MLSRFFVRFVQLFRSLMLTPNDLCYVVSDVVPGNWVGIGNMSIYDGRMKDWEFDVIRPY